MKYLTILAASFHERKEHIAHSNEQNVSLSALFVPENQELLQLLLPTKYHWHHLFLSAFHQKKDRQKKKSF